MFTWSLKSSDRVIYFALLHMDTLRQKFCLYCKNMGLAEVAELNWDSKKKDGCVSIGLNCSTEKQMFS